MKQRTQPAPSRIFGTALRALTLACALAAFSTATFAAKWDPIDPAELTDTQPRIDAEAGAEVLAREVTIDHAVEGCVRTFYLRAKIFSERGLEDFAKIEIPYDHETDIRNISVRTLNPDGQSLELAKKDIYDREVIKVGTVRMKVKSFAPAGLQVGSIVEYRYTQTTTRWEWYVSFFFQDDLPARHVRVKYRPMDASSLALHSRINLHANALFFNCPDQPFKPDRDGYFVFTMQNLAAAKKEPHQPPPLTTNASVLICYSIERSVPQKEYWPLQGKELHERLQKETKPNKLIRTTLASIVAEQDTGEQKLRKIYDYCRTKIPNRYSDAFTFTREQRKNFVSNETAADTLKRGYGTGDEINILCVALARAAGLDARFASCNNRSFVFFNPTILEPFMLGDLLAAVELDGKWIYLDPGATYLPYGMVFWRNESTAIITAAPKDSAVTSTPISPPDASQRHRKAKLQLQADGTLEGDVVVEYTGHAGAELKFSLDGLADTERETFVRDAVQAHLKLAELTAIKVENAADPLTPLKISYHMRVPEYADRTGSRLFVQPAVFQKGAPSAFPDEKRRTNLMFEYLYRDLDEIRILPPQGYELEQASAPGSLSLGGMGSYETGISVGKRSGELIYRRTFTLTTIGVEKKFYEPVRAAFETIHQRDAHTITLRRKPPAAPASSESAAPAPAKAD